MSSPARIPRIYDLRDAQTRDRRDVVVLQAITNVTDRQRVDGWWVASPGDRTQAIYDEIRRLDRARATGAAGNAENLAMQRNDR
jgi:type IV secretory pathway VirJ component